ncbi:hypothetical protein C8R44DRAFT_673631, partial [Mycena epipterygia]
MPERLRTRLKGFFSRKPTLPPADALSTPPEVASANALAATPNPLLAPSPTGNSPVIYAPSTSAHTSTSTPTAIPLDSVPTATSDPVVGSKSAGSGLVIDNIALTLGLVEKLAGLFQTVPFIAPVAGAMSEILKAYKEVKDTNDKREGLLARITDLSHDLCATVLRMEATKHVDLIGRLKEDVETYAKLLEKASRVVTHYANRGTIVRVAARTQLGNELSGLERDLDSFGARFRSNRLVDLVIHQNITTGTINEIYGMAVIEKLEKWLGPPPDMLKKQHDTQELHKEGTGRWLLDGTQFIEWQDNSGALWIQGPSGSGKSVLSSAVIHKLINDQQLFKDLGKSSAVGFCYFDFRAREGHAVENALRRLILQLSAQSPHQYAALDKRYRLSNGQTLPTYQDLQQILRELLLEIGRTYIVLDALDECQDSEFDKLVDFVSTLWNWSQSPMHLLITSQPRTVFTDGFKDMRCISLGSDITTQDIKLFVDSEFRSNRKIKTWASRADYITDRIVRKSNGMFRLAACLLVELSHCTWEDEFDKTLENLPNDLFGIYDRFLEQIPKKDLVHAKGVLRWLVFVDGPQFLNPVNELAFLADTISFDFSDPKQYIYYPGRRDRNLIAIPEWLEGLIIVDGSWIELAHASVEDYIRYDQFTDVAGLDLGEKLSHTFIAQSCLGYLLHFGDHPLDSTTFLNYPLAVYAAQHWCYHLLRSHDHTILFDNAMRLLENGSQQFIAFHHLHSANWRGEIDWFLPPFSPLYACSLEGYTDGVLALLKCGADINLHAGEYDTALQAACERGHTEIVGLLLASGADVNVYDKNYGTALQVACRDGHTEIVRLLLGNGADANANEQKSFTALMVASMGGHTEIVGLLLASGTDVNVYDKNYVTALQAACKDGHTEIVRLLLGNGADANANEGEYDPAL